MIQQIECDQVREGMYISGFGGSWFDHPFWRAKFVVTSPQDIEKVRNSSVPYVLIDDDLGVGLAPSSPAPASEADRANQNTPPSKQSGRKRAMYRPITSQGRDHDQDAAERQRAAALVSQSKQTMRTVFGDARMGCAIHSTSVNRVVEDVTEAVIRNANVLLNVVKLKSKDDYTYLHSVAVCALMVCTGKYLKMKEDEVRDLGLAGLLHDVGKIGIPDEILNKQGRLTDAEYTQAQGHPEHGFQLLNSSAGITDMAMDVCRHHHEKMDGTGYPFGLRGEDISFAARLGAICDVYDALTSDRVYKKAWTPKRALAEMWAWEGHFDRTILSHLMLAIGVVPAGMLVKLSDGHLARTLDSAPYDPSINAEIFYCTLQSIPVPPSKVSLADNAGDMSIASIEEPARWDIAN